MWKADRPAATLRTEEKTGSSVTGRTFATGAASHKVTRNDHMYTCRPSQ